MDKSLRLVLGLTMGTVVGVGGFIFSWIFLTIIQWPVSCVPDQIISQISCYDCPATCEPEREFYFYLQFFGLLAISLILSVLSALRFTKGPRA